MGLPDGRLSFRLATYDGTTVPRSRTEDTHDRVVNSL
jgi:hypothetical protein